MKSGIPTRGTTLASLWRSLDLPDAQLANTQLTGAPEILPSSFRVTTAAQTSIATAASAACLIAGHRTDKTFRVSIDSLDAALECTSCFSLDNTVPPMWADFSGLYKTIDGFIRIHANFDHHRDCFLQAIGLDSSATRQAAEAQVKTLNSNELETAVIALGGACAALRSVKDWDALPQANAVSTQPLIRITRVRDAPAKTLTPLQTTDGALGGIRVLDLTRILAGPVCGRTLAAYGADVMLVNSPHLPNIENIIETSRGKLSVHCDLTTKDGTNTLDQLLQDAHVFVQGYRPQSLAGLGYDAESLCHQYPGLIAVSLSAYGNTGPWSQRRGFDSLVQTATGFNVAEAHAYQQQAPRALPVQILDYATGFLMAFGTQAALYRQLNEGGSYHVELSLARTAQWVRELGQSDDHLDVKMPDPKVYCKAYESEYGALMALPHAAVFKDLPNCYKRPSAPPGTHQPVWPAQQ